MALLFPLFHSPWTFLFHRAIPLLASLQSGEELLTLDGHKPLDGSTRKRAVSVSFMGWFFCRESNHRKVGPVKGQSGGPLRVYPWYLTGVL